MRNFLQKLKLKKKTNKASINVAFDEEDRQKGRRANR